MKKIGFIGLGIMGHSMAQNLMNSGYELFLYNRTKEKADDLVESGATFVDDPFRLLGQVDVCCSCVTNSDALFSIIERCNTFPKYWIDFSTIAPSAAIKLSGVLSQHACYFVDAPVTGGDVGARNATLSIMVGCEPEKFEEILPILKCVGKNIINVGNVGTGQLTKCVNQLICSVTIAAMSEGLAFAEKLGLNLEKTIEIVKGGAAGSWALENYAPRILSEEYGPGFYARDMLKDLRFVLDEANAVDLNLPTTVLVKELYEEFVQGEGAELGNHALIKLYR